MMKKNISAESRNDVPEIVAAIQNNHINPSEYLKRKAKFMHSRDVFFKIIKELNGNGHYFDFQVK